MAVWEFKFSLIPIKGIERVHGQIIPVLEQYKPSSPEEFLSLTEEEIPIFINYWEDIEIGNEIVDAIKALLPQCESWSKEAIMFGDQHNRVEIWKDDIHCFLDIRHFSLNLLIGLLSVAKLLNCKIVLLENGEVIEAELDVVVEKIKRSRAYAFCLEPREFLEALEKRDRKLKH